MRALSFVDLILAFRDCTAMFALTEYRISGRLSVKSFVSMNIGNDPSFRRAKFPTYCAAQINAVCDFANMGHNLRALANTPQYGERMRK